jgi:hypothetical protein
MQNNDRFKSIMAVIVAVVTVLGAMAACLATVAMSDAADADFAGIDAAIRAQKAEIVNEVNAYEHYRAFTEYTRYLELGNMFYDPNADKKTSVANGTLQREAWGVASGIIGVFFKPRYITLDGKYDVQRELAEEWADDSKSADLNPPPHFTESDQLRKRSSFLTADMIVFALSFWFLTLAQTTEKGIKYLWATLGVLLGFAGVIGVLLGRFLI